TKLPEQPLASRSDERRASSSQPASGVKPYFLPRFLAGKLSKVHIPSSAWAAAARTSAQRASRFMGRACAPPKAAPSRYLRAVPLRAAQLFVRCGSLEELGEALTRSLPRL